MKNTPGSANVPIRLGEQIINPDDVICAGDDGVVVVARAETAWAIEQSGARLANEGKARRHLDAGELGLNLYGRRDKLTAMDVEWVRTLQVG